MPPPRHSSYVCSTVFQMAAWAQYIVPLFMWYYSRLACAHTYAYVYVAWSHSTCRFGMKLPVSSQPMTALAAAHAANALLALRTCCMLLSMLYSLYILDAEVCCVLDAMQ